MSELRRVLAVGGVIIDSYVEASDREMAENYPPEVGGLYPRATGTFARSRIGSLRIYIPKKETT